jgi:peroxiredoxin
MKKYLVAACVLFPFTLIAQNGSVVFRGTLSGPTGGHTVYLYNNATKETDSSRIVDGTFTIVRPFTVPTRHFFYTSYDVIVKKAYYPFGIFIDGPCEVRITGDITKGFVSSKVSGSVPQALYDEFNQKKHTAADALSFVRGHNDSYAALYVLKESAGDLPVDTLEAVFGLLSGPLKGLKEGKSLADLITGERNSGIGHEVKDFTLETPEGRPFTFSSLRGKYVLIDLWASWCGPCRESFKTLRPLYEEYRDRNFEIVGISVDKDHQAWKKAIQSEKLLWTQVIDGEGDKNVAMKQFVAMAIPKTYLVGPDGRIVAKDLEGDELAGKLGQLLK